MLGHYSLTLIINMGTQLCIFAPNWPRVRALSRVHTRRALTRRDKYKAPFKTESFVMLIEWTCA